MPPRLRVPSPQLAARARPSQQTRAPYICPQCQQHRNTYASVAATPTPQPIGASIAGAPPIARYPRTQPPSYKPPEFRKSQLHRHYQSLLRSSPLMVIFQHNNLKANEWVGIRRELNKALWKVDEELRKNGKVGEEGAIGEGVKMQVVQTGIFASALKVVEFWNPKFDGEGNAAARVVHPTDPAVSSSEPTTDTKASNSDPAFTHGLSKQAWTIAKRKHTKHPHGLEPLLSGPLALLTLPTVSPEHLKAALSILSPGNDFPAPKRRTNPGYHEPDVQNGLKKLMLLAARVEGRVFDMQGARWVGGIEGGMDGLRGQLVGMLQSLGSGITNTLEAAGRSLYVTVEGRRGMLEEEERGAKA